MSLLENIKEHIKKYIIPVEIFEEYIDKYGSPYYKPYDEFELKYNNFQNPVTSDMVKLSDYLTSSYLEKDSASSLEILKTIINVFDQVGTSNQNNRDKYYFESCFFDQQVIFKELSIFLNIFIEDVNNKPIIQHLITHEHEILFKMLINHIPFYDGNRESSIHEKIYNSVVDDFFIQNISFEVLNQYIFLREVELNIDHSWFQSICIIKKYFKCLQDSAKTLLFYEDYYHNGKTHPVYYSSVMSFSIEDMIKEGLKNGTIDKKDFFGNIFNKSFVLDKTHLYQSSCIRNYLDKESASMFHSVLYEAIPDKYSIVKEDRCSGIFNTIKHLSEIPETKDDPVIQIFRIIHSGESKKLFINAVNKYGSQELAKKILLFKKAFPNIYKSTFEGKNPICLSKSKLASQALFEQVMIYVQLEDVSVSEKNKKRL